MAKEEKKPEKKEPSLDTLKIRVYDLHVTVEQAQREIGQINDLINKKTREIANG